MITLNYAGLSTTITDFVSFSRNFAGGNSVDYAHSGTPILKGFLYAKYKWQVDAIVEDLDRHTLFAIISAAHNASVAPDYTGMGIELSDYYYPIIEQTAKANRPALGDKTEFATGWSSYHAKFSVSIPLEGFQADLIGTRQGLHLWQVQFEAVELDRLTSG